MLSLGQAVLAVVAVSLGYFILWPIIWYLYDPLDLRKYPSPSKLAAITPLWLMWETWKERRSATIHQVHKDLGDIVRFGPNLLLFNDPRAIADIYSHQAASKIMKDGFYDKVAGDFHDIVNTRDRADHSRKRKYLANSFALKTVVDMEPVIRRNAAKLLARIDEWCENRLATMKETSAFNIRQWLNYFTLDVIGDMAFGLPMGFLDSGSDTKTAETKSGSIYTVPSTIYALQQGVRYTITLAQVVSLETMGWLKFFTKFTAQLRRLTRARYADDFENICIHQLRRRMDKGMPERQSKDFVNHILNDRTGEGRNLPFMEMVADSIVFMNAGSDTTAAALSSTVYHLLSNKECLEKLRSEVEAHVSPSDPEIVPYDLVKNLPYLGACIDETLRLRPPIAYPLQRVVYAPEGAIVAGHHLRQGTVVAVPTFSIHRKESLFPEPDRFNPKRWLNQDDPDQIHNLKAYNIPFSQGARTCLGRHIAVVELHILISTLVRKYDMELERYDQKLEIHERFNSNPGPLPIRIRKREVHSN